MKKKEAEEFHKKAHSGTAQESFNFIKENYDELQYADGFLEGYAQAKNEAEVLVEAVAKLKIYLTPSNDKKAFYDWLYEICKNALQKYREGK